MKSTHSIQRVTEYASGQMIRRKTIGWFEKEVRFASGLEVKFAGGFDGQGYTEAYVRTQPEAEFIRVPGLREGRRLASRDSSGVELACPSGDGGQVFQRVEGDSSMRFEYHEPWNRWVARVTMSSDGSLPPECSFNEDKSRLTIHRGQGVSLEFPLPLAVSSLNLPVPLNDDLREMQERLNPPSSSHRPALEFARASGISPETVPFEYSNCHRYG